MGRTSISVLHQGINNSTCFINAKQGSQECLKFSHCLRNPDPREDPKSRSPNFGMQYSYGVDCRTLRWIYFLDPPSGLGRHRAQGAKGLLGCQFHLHCALKIATLTEGLASTGTSRVPKTMDLAGPCPKTTGMRSILLGTLEVQVAG